jgi:hypothetical protein
MTTKGQATASASTETDSFAALGNDNKRAGDGKCKSKAWQSWPFSDGRHAVI